MKIDANVMVKNEALLLEEVLPEWDSYPIDHFVFYDDGSTDGTREVIEEQLESDRFTILSDDTKTKYHESYNRQVMLNESRRTNADMIVCIDADELLSDPMIDAFDDIMRDAVRYRMHLYWWNLVGGMTQYRTDPAYFGNYQNILFPVHSTRDYDVGQLAPHQRIPQIDLPAARLPDDCGFIHLQSVNIELYALKQLWYKTIEHVEYGKTIDQINAAYDPVVNGLDFCPVDLPPHILHWDEIDCSVFDKILEQRGYKDYINENRVPELITFGEEYLYVL